VTERFLANPDGSITVENPGEIYHLLQIKYALRIEINTGMKHSKGSIMNMAKVRYGFKGHTKREVLKEVEAALETRAGKL
jgi:hypothetical protein